jgi:hypothetical protein
MNITKKVITTVSGAALAGVLVFGVSASAAGPIGQGDNGAGSGNHPRAEFICDHHDEIAVRLSQATTKIQDRIAELTQRRAKADQAGHTEIVTRIDKRLDHLNKVLARVTKRAEQLPVFVAAHCPVPTTQG